MHATGEPLHFLGPSSQAISRSFKITNILKPTRKFRNFSKWLVIVHHRAINSLISYILLRLLTIHPKFQLKIIQKNRQPFAHFPHRFFFRLIFFRSQKCLRRKKQIPNPQGAKTLNLIRDAWPTKNNSPV